MKESIVVFGALLAAMGFASGTPNVTFSRATLPVLSGEALNHLGFACITKDAETRDRVTGVSYSFKGTDCLEHIEFISIYEADSRGRAKKDKLIATSEVTSESGHFRMNFPLTADTCHLAFTVQVDKEIPLSGRVNLNCTTTTIAFKQGNVTLGETFTEGLSVGLPLRKWKQDGVNTSRIPGLLRPPKAVRSWQYTMRAGTLAAISKGISISP